MSADVRCTVFEISIPHARSLSSKSTAVCRAAASAKRTVKGLVDGSGGAEASVPPKHALPPLPVEYIVDRGQAEASASAGAPAEALPSASWKVFQMNDPTKDASLRGWREASPREECPILFSTDPVWGIRSFE